MAVQFSEIVKDPEFVGLSVEEKTEVADRYFQNVVRKDPEFGQMAPEEQSRIHTRLYDTAGLGVMAPDFTPEPPSVDEPPTLKAGIEHNVSLSEGLGNLAKATGRGLASAGQALTNPQTYVDLAKGAGSGIWKELQTRLTPPKDLADFGEKSLMQAAPLLPGALQAGRDLAQGVLNLPADIGNAYEGRHAYDPAVELPDIAPELREKYPASSFVGEQVPYLLPITRAARAGKIGGAVAEGAAIGGLIDPGEQGFEGRVSGAGMAGGLTGLVGGIGKVLGKAPLTLKGRVEEVAPVRDLAPPPEVPAVQDLAMPNQTNPLTGQPYDLAVGSAKDSAQAFKSHFDDVKVAENLLKQAMKEYNGAVKGALQQAGKGVKDITEAQQAIASRIRELEELGNTGQMTEAHGQEWTAKRDAYDRLLQAGKNLRDADMLYGEISAVESRAEFSPPVRDLAPPRDLAVPSRWGFVEAESKPPVLDIVVPPSDGSGPILDYLLKGNDRPLDLGPRPAVHDLAMPPVIQESTRDIGDAGNTRELGFIRTMRESPATAPELQERLTGEYTPIHNDVTLERAKDIVDADPEAAYKQVMRDEEPTAETYAIAQDLMRRYQNAGDFEAAADLAEVIAERATRQGQAIQALSMWGRFTPEGALVTAERLAKKAGQGESKQAAAQLADAVERFRASGDKKAAAQIRELANKTSRASFKKALARLSQDEINALGRLLGC